VDNFIFQTPTQIAILILLLIAGWFFGLASHPGGKRWKRRYRDLELETRRYREEKDAELKERDREIRELRAERDKAVKERDKAIGTGAAATSTSIGERIMGFGRDELSRIRGIDGTLQSRLNDQGYKSFKSIAELSDESCARIEERLDLEPGRIEREGWRRQAELLREGKTEEHAREYR